MFRSALILLLAWMLSGSLAAAQEKELHWQSVDVRAHLDADGALHVRETQAMVFNGDWNGGERRFSIRPGQRLKFERLIEKDPEGNTLRELQRGDLKSVGEYRWFKGHVLRWRNRLPADPPFRDALRIYELDYVIAGVLQRRDGRYFLDHDFAFPDRSAIIEHLHGELTLDPAWRELSSTRASFDVDALPPGRGAVRSVALEYVGAGHPMAQGEVRAVSGWVSDLVWAMLVALVLAGAIVVVRRERDRGRFEPLDSPDTIDAAWLGEHLLKYRPEDVGAAWDGNISTHEVMAILARMSQAGQLSSEVKSRGSWIFRTHVLHLKLLVDADSLPPTDRALARKLFFDGPTTDTDRIRAHYQAAGFDPAQVIRKYVKPRSERIAGRDEKRPSWHWKVSAGLIVASTLLIVIGAVLEPATTPLMMILALGTAAALTIAILHGRVYRNAPVPKVRPVLMAFVFVGGSLWGLRWALHSPQITSLECLGLVLLAAGLLHLVPTTFLCRRSAEDLRRRRRLLAARNYFRRELRQPSPQLEDAWFPYLLAFGLGPDVDRWFKVSGGGAPSYTSYGHSGGPIGGSASPTWTGGGGGSFAGGGASGTWVSAVSTLAAGVSAPSSSGGSSGGGGGGGGGGSSGGGGGGGW